MDKEEKAQASFDTNPENLDQEALAHLILDFGHRIMLHHGLWFTEVRHQMGSQAALEVLADAWNKSSAIQMKRLSKILGFDMQAGLPAALVNLPREKLLELLDSVAVNWLANDGVWFQTVEFQHGMNDAKRCNDSCWAHFSPFEAWSIKRFLDMPPQPGLDGLKTALNYRLYGRVNQQSICEERPDSFVFQMNRCRVQDARQRRGLDDYPCKSVGLVEYAYFARAVDPRIVTECIGCPPDPHPPEWFCAWRFSIPAHAPAR